MQLVKQLRQRLAAGEKALGTFVAELNTAIVPPVLKQNGFDFMLIDTEHGCFNPAEVANLIQLGKRAELCPLVRVPSPDRAEIKRVLDAGAEGVMIPMSASLDDVRETVANSKYPPIGQRGAHLLRPHTDYVAPADAGEFMQEANDNLLTIVQIETEAALELCEEIAAMEGVDMLYVGPSDLSIALGHPMKGDHPDVLNAVERVGKACRAGGKIAGSHLGAVSIVPELVARDVQFLGFSSIERMLTMGVAEVGSQLRANIE